MDIKSYLKNALELEKSIYTLDKSISYLKYRGNQLSGVARQYQKPAVPEQYTSGIKIFAGIGASLYLGVILAICLGLPIGIVLGIYNLLHGNGFFIWVVYGILCVGLIGGSIGGILCMNDDSEKKKLEKYNEELRKYNRLVQKEQARVQKELQQKRSIESQIAILTKQKNETLQTRAKLYDMNVIYSKYRSFVAIATMYEYFESGRCNTLEGHEGLITFLKMKFI